MKMKFTSIQAYHELLEKKIITRRCMEVIQVLKTYGPMTAGEIFKYNQIRHIGHSVVKGSICARLAELEYQAIVQAVGQKKCALTGKLATVWALTDNLPTQRMIKPKPKVIKTTEESLEGALKLALKARDDSPMGLTPEECFKVFITSLNGPNEGL